MSLLDSFNAEFVDRHDFYSDDLNILFGKWQNIKFENIPEAWIILIDNMLLDLSKFNILPKRITQSFGQLLVIWGFLDNITEIQENIIKSTSEEIKLIDEDLYLYFDIDMGIKISLATYH